MAVKPKRVTRRPVAEGAAEKQDEFIHATAEAMTFAQKHKRPIILGSIAAAVVVFGSIGIYNYLEYRTLQRSDAFFAALDSVLVPVVPKVEASTKDARGLPEAFPTYEARAKVVKERFGRYLADYGDSGGVGVMAKLAQATMTLDEGNAAEAIGMFQALLDDSDVHTGMRVLVLDGLALAQMNAGKLDDAAKTFDRIAALQGGLLKDYTALMKGVVAEAEGQPAAAKKIYEQARKDSPDGAFAEDIQKRLELL